MFSLWIGAGAAAWACAGFVHEAADLAESDHATVLFELDGERIEVSYEAGYVGHAETFGWVIPVVGDVDVVEDGDGARFDALRALSAPTVDFGSSSTGGAGGGGCALGCGGASKGGGLRSDGTPNGQGFTIVEEGFTGTYAYTVITATDVAELTAWFDDHGWEGLPPEDIDHYVGLGASFVALALAPDVATTPAAGRELPPIRIGYAGEPRFPSVMARHASVPAQRTTAFVVGETRAVVSGWDSEDPEGPIDATALEAEDAFLRRLEGLGDDRAWLRTFAGPDLDGRFVTRFDTYAPTEVHTVDAVFALEDSTESLSTTIDASDGAAASLGLLGLGAWLRRRRAQSSSSLPIEK